VNEHTEEDLGEKSERSFGYTGSNGDVSTDIGEILVKGRTFGGYVGVFGSKIKMVMDSMN